MDLAGLWWRGPRFSGSCGTDTSPAWLGPPSVLARVHTARARPGRRRGSDHSLVKRQDHGQCCRTPRDKPCHGHWTRPPRRASRPRILGARRPLSGRPTPGWRYGFEGFLQPLVLLQPGGDCVVSDCAVEFMDSVEHLGDVETLIAHGARLRRALSAARTASHGMVGNSTDRQTFSEIAIGRTLCVHRTGAASSPAVLMTLPPACASRRAARRCAAFPMPRTID